MPDQESPPQCESGDSAAARERLFATLYAELRRLADRQLHRNAAAGVSPTTLLHETYLDLAQRDAVFPDRARFLGYAARVMRGLIIDFVRERKALKRGAGFHITQLDTHVAAPERDATELSRLSDALDDLATRDPRLAEVVDLRYFCGYSFAEIAVQRGSSERTVQRDWEKARLFLYAQLQGEAL
ncbi:MAG: sigma-70 family RNA polymerase sigma factor [Proteobacteria bacterium]|nr:sigma-70 family RNA polymerase sigma factor [Pseudomonadota bacterium]